MSVGAGVVDRGPRGGAEVQIFQESSSLPLPLGETLGDYTLRSVLGRGGQGVVYLAEPLQDGPTVAIKVPLALAETRLIREAQALEGLSGHPNIVDVLARNLDGSPPHLVFEYLIPENRLRILTRLGTTAWAQRAWEELEALAPEERRGGEGALR